MSETDDILDLDGNPIDIPLRCGSCKTEDIACHCWKCRNQIKSTTVSFTQQDLDILRKTFIIKRRTRHVRKTKAQTKARRPARR